MAELHEPPIARPGDLVFFWGNDLISKVIEFTTFGPSHVGIMTNYKGQLLLAESTTLCRHPCVAQDKRVSGVQLHYLSDRLKDYPKGQARLYPLVDDFTLDASEQGRLEALLTRYLGTTYDYVNAGLTATFCLKYLNPYPDRHSLFCSALVARLYQVLNRLNHGNPEWYSPSHLRYTLLRSAVIEHGKPLITG